MLVGTGLESLCETADNASDLKKKVLALFYTNFDQSKLHARSELLQKQFSDGTNSGKLIAEIF
jgi:hypothetical protein